MKACLVLDDYLKSYFISGFCNFPKLMIVIARCCANNTKIVPTVVVFFILVFCVRLDMSSSFKKKIQTYSVAPNNITVLIAKHRYEKHIVYHSSDKRSIPKLEIHFYAEWIENGCVWTMQN